MGVKIASFNVHNLSYGSGRDLDRIAEIVRQFDIVAMQEVLSEGKALTGLNIDNPGGQTKAVEKSLLGRLGKNWEVRWGNPQTSAKNSPFLGEDSRGEGYAFLWRKDKFDLPKGANGEECIYPKIWDNYKLLKNEGQIGLIRNPFYGRFLLKDRAVEIRLISTHIVFGKPKADNVTVDLGNISEHQMRQNEFHILAGQIYPRVSEYYKDLNCTSPYTIILGDYNLNLASSGVGKMLIQDVICFDQKGRVLGDSENSYCKIYTVQKDLTTLKQDNTGYANNYDHFSYDERTSSIVSKSMGARRADVVDGGDSPPSDALEEYRNKVSDHFPIVIELDI